MGIMTRSSNSIANSMDDMDEMQDQLVVQIVSLMDRLLKKENLDLKLTLYQCDPHDCVSFYGFIYFA